MSDRRVLVIGAGPAGLAAAAELRRRRTPAVILEQADAVGASWRGRYDRLTLNTSRAFSTLPGARFDRRTGVFPSRDDLVRYLEAYARRRRLDVRLNTRVERIDRDDGRWVLRTSKGDAASEQVIVAGGYEHEPLLPEWPGRDCFRGELLHAADYRNPRAYGGRDVLVVGSGCTGIEIAYDLAEGGAGRVRMAVRTPPNILVRSPAGVAIALVLLRLPPRLADRPPNVVRRHELGDLSAYGLPVPEEGVFSRLRRLGVAPAIVDMEWIDAIKQGRIEIVPGVESLDEAGVWLADGSRLEPDAVIAATGYRRGLEPLVGHLGVLDADGVPRAVGGAPAAAGLRFIGYIPRPAQLGYLGVEARRAAKQIDRELARAAGGAAAATAAGTPTVGAAR